MVSNIKKQQKQRQWILYCWDWKIASGFLIFCIFLSIGGLLIINGSDWFSSLGLQEVSSWTEWTSCSSVGFNRTRKINNCKSCQEAVESCKPQGWNEWSRCSIECSQKDNRIGHRLREWKCNDDSNHCNETHVYENETCTSNNLCNLDCSSSFVGDGFCDDIYNFETCNFDQGDCCLATVKSKHFCSECVCYAEPELMENCLHKRSVGNGICDDFTNTIDCGYDGGDCCGPNNYSFCSICDCKINPYELLSSHHIPLISDCTIWHQHLVGDMFCQHETNTEKCNYDGGDCCLPIVLINDCSNCSCHKQSVNSTKVKAVCPSHLIPMILNDHCNDESNVAECDYDGGKCCGDSKFLYCKECLCLDPKHLSMPREIGKTCRYWHLSGNGFCDDVTNNEDCNWDGGDCCKSSAIRGSCIECNCIQDLLESNACIEESFYDGLCMMQNKNIDCLYDGLDCIIDDALNANCNVMLLDNDECNFENNRPECYNDFGLCSNATIKKNSCLPELKADFTCDLINNNTECIHDGGDCLESNNQEAVVIGLGSGNIILSDFITYLANGKAVNWIPRFPYPLENGALFKSSSSSIFICGGQDNNDVYQTNCFMYSYNNVSYALWKLVKTINVFPLSFGHTLLRKKSLGGIWQEFMWFTGGQVGSGFVLANSFQLLVSENETVKIGDEWLSGDDLPIPLAAHCVAELAIGSDSYIVAGGYTFDGSLTARTFLYNTSKHKPESSWSDAGNMRIPRKDVTCLPYHINDLDVVIAVGGTSLNNEALASSEVYYIKSNKWALIRHNLPWPLTSGFALNVRSRLLYVGGQKSGNLQRYIWAYHPSVGWKRSSIILKEALKNHISLTINSTDIKHKKHPNILIFGGELMNGDPAPTEAICLGRDVESILNPYCDSAVSIVQDSKEFKFGSTIQAPYLNPVIIESTSSYMACGGVFGDTSQDPIDQIPNPLCIEFDEEQLKWKVKMENLTILQWLRNQSSHAHSSRNEAWITGGLVYSIKNNYSSPTSYRFTLNKTETVSSKGSTPGPDLPFPLAGHCMVYLGNYTYFLAGGFTGRYFSPTRTAFLQNQKSGKYRSANKMIHARTSHSCMAFELPAQKDFVIVVAGGGISKIETYSFKDHSWNVTEQDFCEKSRCNMLLGAVPVTTPFITLLIGGVQADTMEPSNRIFQLLCPADRNSCHFQQLDYYLTVPRKLFTAFTMNFETADYSQYFEENALLDLSLEQSQTLVKVTRVLTVHGKTAVTVPIGVETLNNSEIYETKLFYDLSFGYGYIMDNQYLIMIGGKDGTSVHAHFFLSDNQDKNDLIKMEAMPEWHYDGAGILMNDKDFWIFGGLNLEFQYVSNCHFLSEGKWELGLRRINNKNEPIMLQFKLRSFCGVNYKHKYAILIGGLHESGKVYKHVMAYNLYPDADDWIFQYKMANLLSPRMSHACTSYYNNQNEYIILVGGGVSAVNEMMLNYVEKFENNQWNVIQEMSFPILTRYAALVAGIEATNKIFLFAGQGADYMPDNAVYEYRNWTKNWSRIGNMGKKGYPWTIAMPYEELFFKD